MGSPCKAAFWRLKNSRRSHGCRAINYYACSNLLVQFFLIATNYPRPILYLYDDHFVSSVRIFRTDDKRIKHALPQLQKKKKKKKKKKAAPPPQKKKKKKKKKKS